MTETATGLIYGHYIDANKPKKQITWRDVNDWQPGQGVLWVHLDAVNETALNWLEHNSGLSSMVKEALLEQGTRPRSAVAESGMIVIFRGVNCNPGGSGPRGYGGHPYVYHRAANHHHAAAPCQSHSGCS